MKEEKQTQAAVSKTAEPKFSKKQLLTAARYADRKDLLSAVLEDGKEYTHDEAQALMDNYLKGKVI